VVIAACSGESPRRTVTETSEPVSVPLLYDMRTGIHLCFEQTGDRYDGLNDDVRDSVIGEWTAKVGIRVTGFGPCGPEPAAAMARGPDAAAEVRVRYFTCERADGADCPDGNPSPGVRVVGRPRDGLPNVIYLRSDYRNHWMQTRCDDPLSLSACTRAYAIHVFGHVLGLDHQQASAGAGCDDRVVYPGGWSCPIAPGPAPTMSYCSAPEDRRQWWKAGLQQAEVDCARLFFIGDDVLPPRREACFYDCCAGDAACEARYPTPWCYPPGDLANVGLSLNDRFARVELRGGAIATGYTHDEFIGDSVTWTEDTPCFAPGMRDNVTSLRVR
jgi:hypothetical protein